MAEQEHLFLNYFIILRKLYFKVKNFFSGEKSSENENLPLSLGNAMHFKTLITFDFFQQPLALSGITPHPHALEMIKVRFELYESQHLPRSLGHCEVGCITVGSGIFGSGIFGTKTLQPLVLITYQWTKSCHWKSIFIIFPPQCECLLFCREILHNCTGFYGLQSTSTYIIFF